MRDELTIQDLWAILKKRIVLILSITILITSITGIVSYFFITPIYSASSQILVNQSNNDQTISEYDVNTNLQLINTYSGIITSPSILDMVIDDLNLDYSAKELREMVAVSTSDDSQIMTLEVQNEKIKTAVDIANKTAEVFQNQIVEIMNVDNVTILSKAEVTGDDSPVSPNIYLNLAIAMVVGLMLGVGIVFMLEFMNNKVNTESDVEEELELPVLGLVSTFHVKDE